MELPAKILNQSQSIEEFRQGSEYKRLKGMVIVMQMRKEISKGEFKEKFFSELNRIGDAFYK